MRRGCYLFPLAIGAAVGLLKGCQDARHTAMYWEYMRCGLYSTCAKILIGRVDFAALIATALLYSLLLVFLVQRRISGICRQVFLAAAGLGYGVLLYGQADHPYAMFLYDLERIRQDAARGILRDAVASGTYQIAASVVVVILGVMLLRRLRGRNRKEESNWSWLAAVGENCWGLVRSGIKVLERQRIAASVILGVLVLANLACACLIARNIMALRQSRSPNIIFIMVDTLRSDHLGCYGYTRDTSPNIDRLARGSLRFSKAIAQSPWTSASVSQFMSGRYQRISMGGAGASGGPPPGQSAGLPRGVIGPEGFARGPMLSAVLQDRGYLTAAVVGNMLATFCGLDAGYDKYTKVQVDRKSDPDVLNGALSCLGGVGNRKFFLFLLFLDVHAPYELHEGYNYDPGYRGKLGKVIKVNQLDGLRGSPRDVEYARALYDSGIRYTDDYIGKLLDALKGLNLYDDTLIVFLADHGEAFAEHGQMQHGLTLYDEALSVPLIIKLPGQKKGRVVEGTCSLLDLFPSIMNYLHFDTGKLGLQGTAFSFDGSMSVRPTAIYSSTDFAGIRLGCLRIGTQKYIHDYSGHRDQLFDVALDTGEHANLANRHNSELTSLHKLLEQKDKQIDASLRGAPAPGKSAPLSGQEKARMRSMGYLQ